MGHMHTLCPYAIKATKHNLLSEVRMRTKQVSEYEDTEKSGNHWLREGRMEGG